MKKPKNTDEYISGFTEDIRIILEKYRSIIKKAAPKAEEVISYGVPAFRYHGILVMYAAFKKHIGFYPHPTAIIKFKEELSKYKSAKGSVQFPYCKPIPSALITKIVKYRIKENLEQEKSKK